MHVVRHPGSLDGLQFLTTRALASTLLGEKVMLPASVLAVLCFKVVCLVLFFYFQTQLHVWHGSWRHCRFVAWGGYGVPVLSALIPCLLGTPFFRPQAEHHSRVPRTLYSNSLRPCVVVCACHTFKGLSARHATGLVVEERKLQLLAQHFLV